MWVCGWPGILKVIESHPLLFHLPGEGNQVVPSHLYAQAVGIGNVPRNLTKGENFPFIGILHFVITGAVFLDVSTVCHNPQTGV